MQSIFGNLEGVASVFDPLALVVPGIVITGLGIFFWLGGAFQARLCGGLIGLIIGWVMVVGLLPSGTALISAIVLGLVAMVFQRIFNSILAGVLVILIVYLFICLRIQVVSEIDAVLDPVAQTSQDPQGMSVQETFEAIYAQIHLISRSMGQGFVGLPFLYQALIAVIFIGLVLLTGAWPRLGLTLCCSSAGAWMILIGMILLLLNKGAQPLTWISQNPMLSVVMLGGMAGVGTLEQLVLCPTGKAGQTPQGHSIKDPRKTGGR